MHTPRIRCNYCSHRIPATSVVCPYCQRNPRAFYWKRWHIAVLAIVGILVLAGVFLFAPNAFNSLANRVSTLQPTTIAAAATTGPPPTPIRIIVVATRGPSTPTRVVPTSTRVPPSVTARPSLTPTITRTPTRIPRTPGQTLVPTQIPTAIPVAAPKLVSPTNDEQIIGANKRVVLTFQPASTIGAGSWYRIQVDFLDRSGQPVSWCAFTKDSQLEFPKNYFDDSSPNVRTFLWRVNVVQSNQVNPSTCDAPFAVQSAPSDVWTFSWY